MYICVKRRSAKLESTDTLNVWDEGNGWPLSCFRSSPTKRWFTQTFYMVHSLIFNSSSVMPINISCSGRKTLDIYKFPSRKKIGQVEIANDEYELMLQTMTFKSDLLFDPKFVP